MKNANDVERLIEEKAVDADQFLTEETEQEGESPQKNESGWRPKLINPAEVEEKETAWLWENKIPLGAISLLAGLQGLGKTFWTCYLASHITNGWDWPDGAECQQGSVMFFYGEDDIASVYRPRLRVQGAVLSNIRFFDGVEILKGDATDEKAISVRDVPAIRDAVKQTEQETGFPVRLVVIDPISNYWGGVKENDNGEIRAALKPIQRLAEESGAAFLLISHYGKSERAYAMTKVLGSVALTAVARCVWSLYKDDDNPDHRLFVPAKGNILIDPSGVKFSINPPKGKVEIIDCEYEKDADEIENERREQNKPGPKSNKTQECVEWLTEYLSDGEHHLVEQIMEDGKSHGYTERTVYRAAKEINVQKYQRFDKKREWWIDGSLLPNHSCQIPYTEDLAEVKTDSIEGLMAPRNHSCQIPHIQEKDSENSPPAVLLKRKPGKKKADQESKKEEPKHEQTSLFD